MLESLLFVRFYLLILLTLLPLQQLVGAYIYRLWLTYGEGAGGRCPYIHQISKNSWLTYGVNNLAAYS